MHVEDSIRKLLSNELSTYTRTYLVITSNLQYSIFHCNNDKHFFFWLMTCTKQFPFINFFNGQTFPEILLLT